MSIPIDARRRAQALRVLNQIHDWGEEQLSILTGLLEEVKMTPENELVVLPEISNISEGLGLISNTIDFIKAIPPYLSPDDIAMWGKFIKSGIDIKANIQLAIIRINSFLRRNNIAALTMNGGRIKKRKHIYVTSRKRKSRKN